MIQPIEENLWWVTPGKLAGVRKPDAAEIVELKATGVGAIVSVMDDPQNLDLYEQANLPYRWLPTKGGTAPSLQQIDWIPLSVGAVRPTQGRTLAVMQVSGGSQSFNAVNTLRLLGRWMRMFTIPNQSSVARAYQEFNEDGTMKESVDRVAFGTAKLPAWLMSWKNFTNSLCCCESRQIT